MKTAQPTKICAAPPQLGSTGAARPDRGAADDHARHLDVVERPPRERHRPGDAGGVVDRRIDDAERLRGGPGQKIQLDRNRARRCCRARRASVITRSAPPGRQSGGVDADRQLPIRCPTPG